MARNTVIPGGYVGSSGPGRAAPDLPENRAEMALLIFLNGKNDLETNAIKSFEQLASVGSSERIHVVVQFGRFQSARGSLVTDYGGWQGVKWFYVTKGIQPTEAYQQASSPDVNMGDNASLLAFLQWAIPHFKAYHYVLDIWDHGAGFAIQAQVEELVLSRKASRGKEISSDHEYNSEMADGAVHDAIAQSFRNVKLDALLFDACLMGMVEVAYAFRDVAKWLVAAEGLVPVTSFPYDRILTDLNAAKTLDGQSVATIVRESYKRFYAPNTKNIATLSILNLDATNLTPLISSINNFSSTAIAGIKDEPNLKDTIAFVRSTCNPWLLLPINDREYVDIVEFFDKVLQQNGIPRALAAAADKVLQAAKVVDAWKNSAAMPPANGLSIFFPPDANALLKEPSYRPGVGKFPVRYVKDALWQPFLAALYLNQVGGAQKTSARRRK